MLLYSFPFSPNSVKVAAVLHHLSIPHEVKILDLTKGESKTSEFMAVNPNGMTPTLVDGDLALWESNAIITYLAEKMGSDLMPGDARGRAEVNRWLYWQACHWMPALGTITFERLAPGFFEGHQTDQAAVTKALENLQRFGAVLDAHLNKHPFVALDRLTLADFAMAAGTVHRQIAQISLEAFPNILNWVARIEALPAWQKSLPAMAV